MELPRSPHFLLLLGALLTAGDFLATLGLGRLAATPVEAACAAPCDPSPARHWQLDPDKARRFARAFQD